VLLSLRGVPLPVLVPIQYTQEMECEGGGKLTNV
jgi:hypothetical protein